MTPWVACALLTFSCWATATAATATAATATAPLPAKATATHLGVGSCASSVCHGGVQPGTVRPGALMNEFVTWSHEDSHAKAFQALSSREGRSIAAKLGIGSAETAKICLDCHADNVPPNQRGKKFTLADGVGCEACHGGSERWIASHAARSNYRTDVKNGMYPTADLRERGELCLSCHYGADDKFATHRIMGAGHPRLSFELDTFLALEPVHYRIDDHYRERKPVYSKTETWSRGQLLAALAQLKVLEGPIGHAGRTFPELALFNCSSCHDSSMKRLEWRPRELTKGIDPGTVALNDAGLRMAWVIARTLSPRDGDTVKELILAVQKDAVANWPHIGVSSSQLQAALTALLARVEQGGAALGARHLLDNVIAAGIDGEYRDYLGAEQAVMAIDLLMMDAHLAEAFRAQRDGLYRLLRSDDTYRATDFIAQLAALRDALGGQTGS